MRKKNLLAVCNNEIDAGRIQDAFAHLEEVELLPVAFSGRDAMELLLTKNVDMLLLDLFLKDVDGMGVLACLDNVREDRRPLVFVMTALPDDRLLYAVKDKAVYCFTKPLKPEILQLRVLELMRTAELIEPRTKPMVEVLEAQIAAEIRAVGVPVHLKGYYYLRDCIRIYAQSDAPVKLSITNDVYPIVAKMNNTRPTLVEHAIRNAIEIAWTRGNIRTLHEYFGYTINDNKGKPGNLEFIAMMAERARACIRMQ